MAFKLLKGDSMGSAPTEYYTGAAGEDFVAGEVLRISGGTVSRAGLDSGGKQQLICAGNVSAAEVATKQVPCYRIVPNRVYASVLTEIGSALRVGDKVTISADGLGVTATTVNGVCELVEIEGILAGSAVHVRF